MRTPPPPPFRVSFAGDGSPALAILPRRTAGALAGSALRLVLGLLVGAVLGHGLAYGVGVGALPPALALIVLGVWAAGFGRVLAGAFVLHAAHETIALTYDRLTSTRTLFGRTRTRSFARVHVRGLRAEADPQAWQAPRGRIAASYGAATLRIGTALTESEARLAIERLDARAPEPAEARPDRRAGRRRKASAPVLPQASALQADPAPGAGSELSPHVPISDCVRDLSTRANLFPN